VGQVPVSSNPTRIDGKCGDPFLQADSQGTYPRDAQLNYFRIADNLLTGVNLNLCMRLAVEDMKSCTQHNGTRIEPCQEENP
jgi:hypothetical protein